MLLKNQPVAFLETVVPLFAVIFLLVLPLIIVMLSLSNHLLNEQSFDKLRMTKQKVFPLQSGLINKGSAITL